MNKLLILLIISFGITACFTTQVALPPDLSQNNLRLPLTIDSIAFVDSRDSISAESDIKLPVFSKQNQQIFFYPALTDTYKRLIEKTIHNNIVPDVSESFNVTVEVLEAEKEFFATWNAEKETVRIKLKISLKNQQKEIYGIAHGEYYVSSLNAQGDRFEKLYRLAIKNVTHEVLKILKEYQYE